MKAASIAVVVVLAGLLTGTALADRFAQGTFLHTNIPYEFVIAGKTYPAGNYEFSVRDGFVTAKNSDTGQKINLGFLHPVPMDGSLARGSERVRISFAVKDGQRLLEAVWPPVGKGYLIREIQKGETRETIKSMLFK